MRICKCCEGIFFVIIITSRIDISHVFLLRHDFRRSHEGFAAGQVKLFELVSNWPQLL